jgi:hypothetical protein
MISDVSRVKFRLETICIDGLRISKDNAVKFFQQQENLKTVCAENFIEPSYVENTEILRSIWSLPKLETFQYCGIQISYEDLNALSDIRNESVKQVESSSDDVSIVDGRIFQIFPNLKSYKIEADNLELEDVPSEKLKTLKHKCGSLFYQPPLADFDQESFESQTIQFMRSADKITFLNLGRDEWIEERIGLSIDFWKSVINILTKLNAIVIYHLEDIKGLVQVLIDCQRNFTSVEIHTNADGRASVEEMELPTWLEVTDIDW